MSIRVTCTGCHTRFNVDEKFAGKEGPCPKCKKPITIPAKSESVEVHAPKEFGPTTTSGQAVFKPITRKDASLSAVQLVLIGATIVGFLAIAFMMKFSVKEKDAFSSWILLFGSIVLAVPCVYAGYAFLRNSDLGSFLGQDLWTRIGACAAIYGLSWLAIPLVSYAVGPELGRFVGAGLMVVLGIAAVYLLLNIDPFMGILHYGLFFGCCILMRIIAGFSALPMPKDNSSKMDDILNEQGASLLETTFLLIHFLV